MTDGYFYSPSTGGFYHSSVNSDIPADAKPLDEQRYQELLSSQDGGAEIVAGSDGEPTIKIPEISVKITMAGYANARQWLLATGGFTYSVGERALHFATDAISYSLITGKALRLQQPGAPASVNWQFASGYEEIAASDFIAASVKIADFVQATFDALQPVLTAINAGTITTKDQVDAAAWPANQG